MRTFIIALLVLAILIMGVFVYSGYIKKIEKELINIIENISVLIESDEWGKSEHTFKELLKKWDKNEKILAMFNDHGDLDEIRLAIGDLKESVSHADSEHALKAIEDIKVLLERLAKNESLRLENILGLAHSRLFCHIML